MLWQLKYWLLRLTEPWREERASLELEWRIYAQKNNAAGHRPAFWYPGMKLDPMEKVHLADSNEVDPNYLRDQFADAHQKYTNRKDND